MIVTSETFINSANIAPSNIDIYIYIYIYATILNCIMLYCHNILSKYQCGFKGQN